MRRYLAVAYALVIAACGSRTALVDDETAEFSDDASVAHKDGGDASRDADAQIKLDGAPDVFVNDCPDASVTFIYLISDARELYSYNPVDGNFRDIGTVNCPTPFLSLSAFSMAVDRQGIAYVLMWDGQTSGSGEIFRVDTANASCTAIPEYRQNQQGFGVFGMGFATNGGGPSERLYVQGGEFYGTNAGLATIDTTTFNLSFIGNNDPEIYGGELTGSGDGRLFGFFFFESDQSSFNLGELDKSSGQLLSQAPVGGGVGGAGGGFAFAFWGGDFYFFTSPNGDTIATRYRPTDQSYETAATLPGTVIVGAGVSTCAPQ
jgi:hypothetical protein